MQFLLIFITLALLFQEICFESLDIVLMYSNANITKVNLIMNQNLKLLTCPSNNISVNFIGFNITSLYKSPLEMNNFVPNAYLVFGPDRYLGPSFFGFRNNSKSFKFASAFYSSLALDLGTRYIAILSVVSKFLQNDTVKAVTFIVNATVTDPLEPWKAFNPHKYLALFRGSLTVLYYTNSTDAVRIASEIISRGITNIVMDLNYNASLLVLNACNDRNLLNWKRRWMIFFSVMPYDNRLATITLPLSNNFTMFEYDRIPGFSPYYIDEERDVYFYDICYLITKMLDYHNCNPPIPSVMSLGTGNFTFSGNVIQRTSWLFKAFRSYGKIENVGNFSLGLNNEITNTIPVFPNLINRTTDQILSEMRSKAFRIAAMIEPPFVIADANGKLSGYSIEMMDIILKNLNITGVVKAYNYSTGRLQNGKFSGILEVVQTGLADIAIGPITYFAKYNTYINFTTQFKPYQLSIMYNNPASSIFQTMFEFIFVFTWHVWVLIVASCIVYAVALTIVNIISPNEATMGIFDTFFFTMGSMVQGVTTALPDKVSGRILVIFWWILNLAIILTYVALYGAMRTNTRLQSLIQGDADLLKQTAYSFGTVINSSVDEYFASSQYQSSQQINRKMRTIYIGDMCNSTATCIKAVQTKSFAFIYEDAILKQYYNIKCITQTVGFDQLYYAYALLDSDYTQIINAQISTMISNGVLAQLDAKYFTAVTQPSCIESSWLGTLVDILSTDFLTNRVDSLTITQTSGIFVIMLVGVFISLFVAIVEFLARKCSKKHNEGHESHA